MKKIFTILFVSGLFFSSCQKCVECTHDDAKMGMVDENGIYQTYGDLIQEVCRDNFESKDDFNDYIDDIEDLDWDCKSDFWN